MKYSKTLGVIMIRKLIYLSGLSVLSLIALGAYQECISCENPNTQRMNGATSCAINDANSNKIEHIDDYGIESVSAHNETFIRTIQREMGLAQTNVTIRKMNAYAVGVMGRENAFVTSFGDQQYLFISEDWFNELNYQEKRYVVGHEFAHIALEHNQKQGVLEYALEQCEGYGDYYLKQNKNNNPVIKSLKKLGFPTLKKALSSLLSCGCEEQADEVAVKKLHCIDGAISIAQSMMRSNSGSDKVYKTDFNLFADHPSWTDRLAKFIHLKNGC